MPYNNAHPHGPQRNPTPRGQQPTARLIEREPTHPLRIDELDAYRKFWLDRGLPVPSGDWRRKA